MKGYIFLFLPLLFAAGCSGRDGARSGSSADSAAADTVELIADKEPAPMPALPDTTLPSARKVDFKVTVKDTLTDPSVDYATDFYTLAGKENALTFRGTLKRDADFGGTVKGTPQEIIVDWTFTTDTDNRQTRYGTWGGGTGWTGQPLLLTDGNGRCEVVVGSLASKIYFIDFLSGKQSRNPFETGNPIKGTVSIDPTLNGNLYAGHGVPSEGAFGALTFNLNSNRLTHTFDVDPKARRGWGAYDSSPVRVGKFVFRPSENGTLYKWLPNDNGEMKLHSLMRYSVNGASPGMEASMAVYRNYGYIADNHGNVICINLDTLRPVWLYATGDDTDATPVIAEEEGGTYVYVASEIDRQGEGYARLAKLDALTGEAVWKRDEAGMRADVDEKHFDGGFYATPLLGSGNASDMIFANLVRNTDRQNGSLVAYSRRDGRTLWELPLRYYSWSSPVKFVNERGEMFILNADSAGNLYLIEALTGRLIDRKRVGSNFESSAVVSGNSAVIGSRGDKIFKVSIK